MMISYLIAEGIMHLDNIESVYEVYSKHWNKKEERFLMTYSTTLNYYYYLYAGIGYFEKNTELDTSLKNDFIKLYTKLHKNASKIIVESTADKFVPADKIVDFVEDISNLITSPPRHKEPKQE